MTFIKNNHYLLLALGLFITFTFVTLNKLEHEVAYEQIVVTEGDTLWAYSQAYAEGMPSEQWIDEVIKVNDLASTSIKVGETLKLPVKLNEVEYNHIATNSVEESE